MGNESVVAVESRIRTLATQNLGGQGDWPRGVAPWEGGGIAREGIDNHVLVHGKIGFAGHRMN